ncbi:hypothetical protein [Pseudomonas marginalis]
MSDSSGHIRNPLTVISRFAAVAEISGTAVLPFIAPENQATYIWFLMLFPTLLVGTFFLTLNFNHKTLYAPSDYQNQNHFLNLFGIVTPDERDAKLSAEVEEADLPNDAAGDVASDAAPNTADLEPPVDDKSPLDELTQPEPQSSTLEGELQSEEEQGESVKRFDFKSFAKRSNIEMMAKLDFIERRAIEKLKRATNINFSEKVKFDIPGLSKPMIFDAVADEGDTIHIAEIKYFADNKFTPSRFTPTIADAHIVYKNISSVSNKRVLLHLIIALDESASSDSEHNFRVSLQNIASSYGIPCRIYIATTAQLSSLFPPRNWRDTH